MTKGSGRTALIAVLGVVGVLALLAGAALALVFGPQGHLQSKATRVAGPGAAILGEGIEVDASSLPIPSWMGQLSLDVRPVGNSALFVGTASQADVDNYLRTSSYDVVTSLQAGSKAQIRSIPGSDLPQPPQAQTFWLSQAVGAPGATVSINSARGDQSSLVVMKRVPSNGVAADIILTLTVGWSWITALVLMGIGAVALLVAIWLAVRKRHSRPAAEETATGPARHAAAGSASTVLPGVKVSGPVVSGPAGSAPAAAPTDPATAPQPRVGSAAPDAAVTAPAVVVHDATPRSAPPD